MPQLQINQGPQDALLYDNSKSYFTNVGYTRTSNFQVEYRKVDSQNTPTWGSTVQYVIPKAADLLGPVDLEVELPSAFDQGATAGITMRSSGTGAAAASENTTFTKLYTQWVDEVGFAMIEKITFSVGSNDIETLTGEQLQIKNELMTSDEMRLGYDAVLKTGKAAFKSLNDDNFTISAGELPGDMNSLGATYAVLPSGTQISDGATSKRKLVNKDYTRMIELAIGNGGANNQSSGNGAAEAKTAVIRARGKKLIIPLGLFFTKHVSQYFPLSAVAGCNDVRISIKFRQLKELLQIGGCMDLRATATGFPVTALNLPVLPNPTAQLMCHYVHVTGPEAQVLMNKEHVRLLKLYQHQSEIFAASKLQSGVLDMNLSFLHPVSTLIITIRATDDLNTEGGGAIIPTNNHKSIDRDYANAMGKGFFFYHGDGTNPNYDRYPELQGGASTTEVNTLGQGTCKVNGISLTLNGQERHPGLNNGIDADYLRTRLMPMLHSNSNQVQKQSMAAEGKQTVNYGQQGSKNIFVYPFSLNPEGSNPSGAVNFSKVSHAKLSLHMDTTGVAAFQTNVTSPNFAGASNIQPSGGYRVDVYALYYNWLQIRDGRALLSFA